MRTPCRSRKLLCATARMLCASDALRPSKKAVIEDRTTHLITSTVVTKHGNAPPGETSEREETTVAIRWVKGKLGLRLRNMIQSGRGTWIAGRFCRLFPASSFHKSDKTTRRPPENSVFFNLHTVLGLLP